MISTVNIKKLGPRTFLGGGNEAQVYALDKQNGIALKLYKPAVIAELNKSSLLALIDTIEKMEQDSKHIVRSRAALPIELVEDSGSWVGFTMPLLPQSFFALHGVRAKPQTVELDWNRLTMSHKWTLNPNIYSEVPTPSEQQLLEIAISLAETVDVLHRHGIVIGDISGRNLLWTLTPKPATYFLDTDSFRLWKQQGTTVPKETDGWRDPTLKGQPTNQSSDLFKMTLAITRSFFNSDFGLSSIKNPPHSMTNISQKIFDFSKTALSYQKNRPSASEWLTILRQLAQEKLLEGRPIIEKPDPPKPKERQTLWADRPIIQLPRRENP